MTRVSGKVVNQSHRRRGAQRPGDAEGQRRQRARRHGQRRGDFQITPQNGKPIAAGQLTLTATFEGFAEGTATGNGVAGRAINGVQIRMKPTAAARRRRRRPRPNRRAPTRRAPGASDIADAVEHRRRLRRAEHALLAADRHGRGAGAARYRRDRAAGDAAQGRPRRPGRRLRRARPEPDGAGRRGRRRRIPRRGRPHHGRRRAGHERRDGDRRAAAAARRVPRPVRRRAPTRAGYGGGAYGDQATSVAPRARATAAAATSTTSRATAGANPATATAAGYRDERGDEAPRGGGYGDDPRGGGGYGGGARRRQRRTAAAVATANRPRRPVSRRAHRALPGRAVAVPAASPAVPAVTRRPAVPAVPTGGYGPAGERSG